MAAGGQILTAGPNDEIQQSGFVLPRSADITGMTVIAGRDERT